MLAKQATFSVKTMLIDGRPLRYRVRRSARARRVVVKVSHREGVVVTLPARASSKLIPDVMAGWSSWLAKKAEQYSVWNGPLQKQYASGSLLMILGEPRTLEITILPAGRSRTQVDLQDSTLGLKMAHEDVLTPRPALEKYLRKLARQYLVQRTDFWAEQTNLHPERVIIGERTSRWGSCSRRRTISYCYRLVMAPPEVVDVVIVHELCHLKHLNHGARFYALLDKIYPEHRTLMDWLRDNEDNLLL